MLSLFDIDSFGKKIISKSGAEVFQELKSSANEGYTEEGNTLFLNSLLNHLYNTERLTREMLQTYDENIVRFTKQISEGRRELITWKYFQYLSLLFTEIYLDKYFSNRVKLLAELNEFAKEYNLRQAEKLSRRVSKKKTDDIFIAGRFEEKNLNKLAFWNATGSGKTLLMHINIKQYLHYAQKYNQKHQNKVLLITPNEALSRQHLDELNLSKINSAIFSKRTSGIFSRMEVEILEVTKLTENSGEKTVAVDSFETDNLVLIDEGHGGMSGDSWKKYRDALSATGFAFEYSATFGQAISAASGSKKTDFTQEYAKSILFDYSYKYFYEDGYGKDYRILNLKEDTGIYQKRYLTANLLSFYQQLLLFKNQEILCRQYKIHKPLWVFVGGKVNAVRNENKRQVSDVLEIIYFLTDFLKNPSESILSIEKVLDNEAGLMDKKGNSIFHSSFSYLQELQLSPQQIFTDINKNVFNNSVIGANLYLDNLKGADGELGLRVGEGDNYFGVINVGDEKVLHGLAIANDVLGSEKDFSSSLFRSINDDDSNVNLLIGSKKFSEGWSSWRVSSMGLMNVGKSEGSQIIQLFGRGVRLKGYNFSLKRSDGLDEYQKPQNIREVKKYLKHLETLQIFGVKADYMEKFKEFLEEEGLPVNDSNWISIKVPVIKKDAAFEATLKIIQVSESENFKQQTIKLEYRQDLFHSKLIELDWYPKIEVLAKERSNLTFSKNATALESKNLAFVNWTKIYLVMQGFKADKGYSNMAMSIEDLIQIIQNKSWYTLYIPADQMEFTAFDKVFLWEELVISLLKKYTEYYYLYYKNQFHSKHIEAKTLNPDDDNFVTEFDVQLNSEEDVEQYKSRLNDLVATLAQPVFSHVKIANEVLAFDNLHHLYKPLIYVGKNYSNIIQVIPIALDQSERQFLDDLKKEVEENSAIHADKEIHVLRNQSRKGLGFFTDGNNFFPDFIMWIIKDGKQSISFIDPKGIRNSRGLSDPKIQFHKVLKDNIQPQVAKHNILLNSFIVSNTKFLEVQWNELMKIRDFHENNVYFQYDDSSNYIQAIIEKSML